MKTRIVSIRFTALALTLFAFVGSWDRLFRHWPADGQMIKQTFAADMIRGFLRGEGSIWVSVRHFAEPVFQLPIRWAEEFPIYSWLSAGVAQGLGWSEPVAGRMVSVIGLLVLLAGFFRIGKFLETQGVESGRWILLALAASSPSFQIYGFSVMPDLWMTSLLVWATLFAFEGQLGLSAVLVLFASLFKYYAVFSAPALAAYVVFSRTRDRGPSTLGSRVCPFILFGLATLPSMAYILWVLTTHIPNPITQYLQFEGQAHFGSLHRALSPHFWARVFLWNFVKGPGLVVGLLAWVGAVVIRKFPRELRLHGLSFGIAGLLFAGVFAPGYFVHDYYALQTQILVMILAALGLTRLRSWPVLIPLLLIANMVIGYARVRSDTAVQGYYASAGQLIERSSQPTESGLLISDRAGVVTAFSANRPAWVISPEQWDRLPPFRAAAEEKIRSPGTRWVALLLIDEDGEARSRAWKEKFLQAGWILKATQKSPASEPNRTPATRFWVFRRKDSAQ